MNPDNSAPAVLAETLLSEWEQRTRPASPPAYLAARPRVLALLAEFSKSLFAGSPVNVDAEDVRSVLRWATTIGLGATVAHGPGRASRAAMLVIAAAQTRQLGPTPIGSAVSSLLRIISGPDCELAMDELTR